MGAKRPGAFGGVGEMGLPIFLGLRDHDIPSLRLQLKAYRDAWRQAGQPGQPDAYVRIPIYAADTESAALDEPRENITYFFRRHAELVRSGLGRSDTGSATRREGLFERVAALTYDEILQTRVAFGTAPRLIDRLREVREELGVDGVVAELNPGGLLSMEQMRRSLRILTHEVIPALR